MNRHTALLVIDVQNDFCSRGALAVAHGEAVVPLINTIAGRFETVVLTQDWHPDNHISFAGQHRDRKPFESITLPYGEQTLWPSHCVQTTHGAELHGDLAIPHASLILRKGANQYIDSYSAFLEADRITNTGLNGYFSSRGITEIFLCGLATDYCVAWSAEDAVHFGLKATIIEDACRAINLNGSLAEAWTRLAACGVTRTSTTAL